MKTVGIIGGLGPETTSEFYLDLIFSCAKKDKTARPAVIISSVPLPYKIEEDLILRSEGVERYIPYLTTEANWLLASKRIGIAKNSSISSMTLTTRDWIV